MADTGRVTWLTVPMPDLPPLPSRPEEIAAWVAGLSQEQNRELADLVLGGGLGRLATQDLMERANPEIDLPPAPAAPSAYTLRIDVADAKPPIWRRLVVRSDVTLDVLHRIIQAAFGWWDYHLHRFSLGDPYTSPYFVTPGDLDEGETGTPEDQARLDQVLTEPGATLTYEYDFGDGWTHRVKLEATEAWPEDEQRTAWCVAGRNAGPLEDSGGIWGFNDLAAWVRSGFADEKAPPDSEDLKDWIPEGFDPDEFSVEDTDAAVREAMLGDCGLLARTAGLRDEAVAFARSVTGGPAATVGRWLLAGGFDRAGLVQVDLAESATRPWRVLLRHVGAGVTLTKAGYLPPAVVEAVFTELGVADQWIGKGNREDLTPPVLRLRELAQDLGLLRKAKGRLLPTAIARRVGDDPVALLRHVAARLPRGKRPDEQQAGWAVLLATAAREERDALGRHLVEILTGLGWTTRTGHLDVHAAEWSAEPTRAVLDIAGGELVFSRRDVPTAEAVAMARLALVGQ